MDGRLIPINGLIALLRGDGGWPNSLGAMGFERHQLEHPVNTPLGDIKVDALVYRRSPDLILLAECKGGTNLDQTQAEKYLSVDETWLRRSGAVPPQLRKSDSPDIRTLFVGREEHRAGLQRGLQ